MTRRALLLGAAVYLAVALGLAGLLGQATRGEPGGVAVRDPVLHCYGHFNRFSGYAGVSCSWSWHW